MVFVNSIQKLLPDEHTLIGITLPLTINTKANESVGVDNAQKQATISSATPDPKNTAEKKSIDARSVINTKRFPPNYQNKVTTSIYVTKEQIQQRKRRECINDALVASF